MYVVDKPAAIIVDIDGTIALRGDRNPFDEEAVGQDTPNLSVVAVVRAMHRDGYKVIFVSGRTEKSRDATEVWLSVNVPVLYEQLLLRPNADNRPDQVLKMGFYEAFIRDQYSVLCVIDDRQRVVDMWRDLGLTCMQVAPGKF